MNMSAACLPPQQPSISDADRAHPLFPEYERHRAAMAAQLVRADSFTTWLLGRMALAESKRWTSHPRHPEYVRWLRENVNCTPRKHAYLTLDDWLVTFR